jgi:hypothetical protein
MLANMMCGTTCSSQILCEAGTKKSQASLLCFSLNSFASRICLDGDNDIAVKFNWIACIVEGDIEASTGFSYHFWEVLLL